MTRLSCEEAETEIPAGLFMPEAFGAGTAPALSYDAAVSHAITQLRAAACASFSWDNSTSPQTRPVREAQSSTQIEEVPVDLITSFQRLWDAAQDEVFEDGVGSQFSHGIEALIFRYGDTAMAALSRFVQLRSVSAETYGEALRVLGQIRHHETFPYRLWLLRQALRSANIRIRDSAALGLTFLDDAMVVPYLREAIQRERSVELARDMQALLDSVGARLGGATD